MPQPMEPRPLISGLDRSSAQRRVEDDALAEVPSHPPRHWTPPLDAASRSVLQPATPSAVAEAEAGGGSPRLKPLLWLESNDDAGSGQGHRRGDGWGDGLWQCVDWGSSSDEMNANVTVVERNNSDGSKPQLGAGCQMLWLPSVDRPQTPEQQLQLQTVPVRVEAELSRCRRNAAPGVCPFCRTERTGARLRKFCTQLGYDPFGLAPSFCRACSATFKRHRWQEVVASVNRGPGSKPVSLCRLEHCCSIC
eukprot:SAG31_NODE_8871_length_1370_cov_1.059795_1_plen_250_part_00